jgi:hypothetical protein
MARRHSISETETQEESFLEFHVLRTACNEGKKTKTTQAYSFLETSMPHTNLQKLFTELTKLCNSSGSRNEHIISSTSICKEYTKYVHWNMELTILPDGSSFCHQVSVLPIESKLSELPNHILPTKTSKLKIANDFFPSKYSYHSVCDTVDVIFPWGSAINVILRLKLEENRSQATHQAKTVKKLYEIQGQKNTWCEILVQAPEYTHEVKSALQFILDSLNKKKKEPTIPCATDDCSVDT